MVDVVLPNNRHFYSEYLEEMHRQRYRVLVERAGWEIPGIEPGFDRDAFDTDQTIYLLEINPVNHELLASVRFNPTTQPHMMTDVFAHQCEFEGIPRSPDIWEGSRYVFEKSRMDDATFARCRIIMGIAMTEFCLSYGIRSMTWLTHGVLYKAAQKWWRTRPLGHPHYYQSDRAEYVAAITDMTFEAGQKLRRAIGEDGPVLFVRDPLIPDERSQKRSPLAA